MMTKVNSDSDSMNARPRVSSIRMPGRAPGLRASASVAEAVARPCPSPQRPAASPMPIPAAIEVRPMAIPFPPPASCANAGAARNSTPSIVKRICSFRIVVLRSSRKCTVSGWLMLTVLAPSRSRPMQTGRKRLPVRNVDAARHARARVPETLMIVRRRLSQINHRQQHEHIRLNDGHAQVQPEKHRWDCDRHQREERQRHQVAGKHICVKTYGEREDARKVRDDLDRQHQPGKPPDRSEEVLQVANRALLAKAVVLVVQERQG